jgi:hypothetical protein
LGWQNAVSPSPETELELTETRDKYRDTCVALANYYVMADSANEWKLALPYYRMSQQAAIGTIPVSAENFSDISFLSFCAQLSSKSR